MNMDNRNTKHGGDQKLRSGPTGRELFTLTLVSLLALAGLSACDEVRAEAPVNLEFRGTLVSPPPCVIDNDGTIMTNFGERVGIRKVASGIYREDISLTLNCEHGAQAWQLMLTVTGNAAGFDVDNATVVSVQQADLGVKLLLGGKPFELDRPVKVNATALSKLEAVLVQRDEAELSEGDFTAQATLRADYQ